VYEVTVVAAVATVCVTVVVEVVMFVESVFTVRIFPYISNIDPGLKPTLRDISFNEVSDVKVITYVVELKTAEVN
jgi:hypothetical protein